MQGNRCNKEGMNLYRSLSPLLRKIPAEAAHHAALQAVAAGLVPGKRAIDHPALRMNIGGVTFRNPVGLAPGFDKNGEAAAALLGQGFGFVECGTVTPRAQPGNPKPRLFRLDEDEAVINRMGFNNDGLAVLRKHINAQYRELWRERRAYGVLGINIGKNKSSQDAIADYLKMLEGVHDIADYVTLNISSPNTPGLRDLQASSELGRLLDAVCHRREQLAVVVPIWLKLAPDLTDDECAAIAETVVQYPINALIIGNTTVSRPDTLRSEHRGETGGLSGKPLMDLSTDRLRLFRGLLGDGMPLVGVGGIRSAEDAYTKIKAGATLVQLYTGLVYHGFGLVRDINVGLLDLLKRDGHASLAEVVGKDVDTVNVAGAETGQKKKKKSA